VSDGCRVARSADQHGEISDPIWCSYGGCAERDDACPGIEVFPGSRKTTLSEPLYTLPVRTQWI
jgi:hypothetical protein